jgi:hypothetical protein
MANGTKKSAARKQPAKTGKGAKRQLTCFVVTGFGNKTDYSTGRVLNLDKTYEQLIRPACDEVNVNCFRAVDANLTGSIDSIMYRWIYEADIVIADLSTLNVCMANCNSSCNWELEQTAAMLFPRVAV